MKAHINENHQSVCVLNALGIERKTITSTAVFPTLKDISLTLAIMVDDKNQLRNTKILSLGTLQKILIEWGGVQVRYKGVRVYPYGDDDWLDIDHDRGLRRGSAKDELFSFAQTLKGVDPGRSLLNQLSMRNYVGNVEIGQQASGFEMKLNREGFVSSEAVIQLKEFVRFAIHWSTILREHLIRQESRRQSAAAKKNFEEIIGTSVDSNRVVDSAVENKGFYKGSVQ